MNLSCTAHICVQCHVLPFWILNSYCMNAQIRNFWNFTKIWDFFLLNFLFYLIILFKIIQWRLHNDDVCCYLFTHLFESYKTNCHFVFIKTCLFLYLKFSSNIFLNCYFIFKEWSHWAMKSRGRLVLLLGFFCSKWYFEIQCLIE